MVSRRSLLGTPLWAALGVDAVAQGQSGRADPCNQQLTHAYQLPIASGPFQPTAGSLKTYRAPTWFRDAKFGIWAH
jgi:alpha-L-fucosidase